MEFYFLSVYVRSSLPTLEASRLAKENKKLLATSTVKAKNGGAIAALKTLQKSRSAVAVGWVPPKGQNYIL